MEEETGLNNPDGETRVEGGTMQLQEDVKK